MSYGVCVHFSLPPSYLLCTGSLSAHVLSMVLMSGGFNSHCFLNRVKSKAFPLIDFPPLTDCLDSFSHRCNVASLSLFYRYLHADSSSELATYMPLSLPWPRCTRLSTSSHPCSIHLSNARVNQYLHFFVSYIGKLCNSLPLSVFPPAYDLNFFKR